MKFNAVFFDLDGTLYELRPTYADHLFRCMADEGIAPAPDDHKAMERWIHRYWALEPRQSLQDSPLRLRDALLIPLCDAMNLKVSHDTAQRIAIRFLKTFSLVPFLMPGAKELLTELRRRGLRIGVLTNRDEVARDELQALGIGSLIDIALAAGDIGAWKPQPGFFLEALRRAGELHPQETMYVGDNYFVDVLGATSVGIRGILFDYRRIYEQPDCPIIYQIKDVLKCIDTNPTARRVNIAE